MRARNVPAVTVCSTAFEKLGQLQAKSLGDKDLPLTLVPHPFGALVPDKVREAAAKCIADIERIVRGEGSGSQATSDAAGPPEVEIADDAEAINSFFIDHKWSDGLPMVPPTRARVDRMLKSNGLDPNRVIGKIAPGFGTATVELIAVNAVMAGCLPEHLPVLVAAVEAVISPELNIQGLQATTNPVAVWLIVTGPAARRLGMNSGPNCLGQGNRANATLGRALHLVLQNIGGCFPGEMDRATQGQPGKYLFCCAESDSDNPWEPLHVERGFAPGQSAVTVVGAEGSMNLNAHTKDGAQLVQAMALSIKRPCGNDYRSGGEPWFVISPEHAQVLHLAGYSKAEVKKRLWELSKTRAGDMAEVDFLHSVDCRRHELGEITRDTLLPIAVSPEAIYLIVAGGPGTHSTFVPSFGNTKSVTRLIAE
jgi:hypothetical protein